MEAPVSDNCYVTNLPPDVTMDTLRAGFEAYGATVVQGKVLPSATPGQGTCAALCRFSSVAEAQEVVSKLYGCVLPGMTEGIRIKFANAGGAGPPPVAGAPSTALRDGGAAYDRQRPYSGKGGGQSLAPQPPVEHKSDNLYISGLPVELDTAGLSSIFSQYGQVVQCRTLNPKYGEATTRSALVRFSSIAEARSVKEHLSGCVPEGLTNPIAVEYADSPEGDKGDGKGIGVIVRGFEVCGALPGGKGWVDEANAVYMAGLPADCDNTCLYRIFSPFGAIAPRGVRAVQNPDGTCKGIAFVNYLSAEAAQAAIRTLNGMQMPEGGVLKVSIKAKKNPNAIATQPFGGGGKGKGGGP